MLRGVVKIGAVVIVLSAIAVLQGDLRRLTGQHWQRESMTYLPAAEQTEHLFLGFQTTVAHYLWIRTILYFGGHYLTDGNYTWLVDMLDIITRLCPWFYPAYEFAGLIVPDLCNNPEAARIILERGITHLGMEKWNVAFYSGMIHFKYYDDRKTAANYFLRAALANGAPREKLLSMAKMFHAQAGIAGETLRFLLFAYEASDNPDVRRHLAAEIKKYGRENIVFPLKTVAGEGGE